MFIWNPERDVVRCAGMAAADSLAAGLGTATEVARGAQGSCGVHFARYREAAMDFFAVGVTQPYEREARRRAEERADRTRSEMTDVLVARVLNRRAGDTLSTKSIAFAMRAMPVTVAVTARTDAGGRWLTTEPT